MKRLPGFHERARLIALVLATAALCSTATGIAVSLLCGTGLVAAGTSAGIVALLLCILAGLVFSRITDPLIAGLRESRERLRKAHAELEQRVEERTAELEQANRALKAEVAQRLEAEAGERRKAAVLDGINRVLQETLACDTEEDVAKTCLAVAEELTGSAFGFVRELNQQGRVDTPAVSDPGMSACDMPELSARTAHRGRKARGLWGLVLTTGRGLIANDPASHPDRVGTPAGHPPLSSFLGVPLVQEGKTTGMMALANKEGGYTADDQDAIERLAAVFVEALGRKRIELAVQRSEMKYRTLFTQMLDGFALHEILCDESGRPNDYRYLEINPALERLAGMKPGAGVGKRALELFPNLNPHWIEQYGRVALGGEPIRFEMCAPPLGRHLEVVASCPGPGLFATIFRDVTDQRQAQAEIVRKNRDLETLLYVTSHDLREPLRAIRNFSQMVYDRYEEQLDDKGRDFLRRVVLGGQRMERLIDDVLQLSRAQRTIKPDEWVEGREVVDDALESLEATIGEKDARVRIVGDLPRFRGDRVWACRALFNLIANALKFVEGEEPPQIEIAAYQPDGGDPVGFVVRDRGPGVNPEYAERLFGLFQRAVGREIPGTGAGLAIVREVAERHGGHAWVEPREGGGSEFIITFRLGDRGQAERR